MLRGMGGGGGGGGMPDLASIMNNPQMMAMAQQMMANGGLANLMQNPAVASMACVLPYFLVGSSLIDAACRWTAFSAETCLHWQNL